jgi:hypothetical protein
MIQNEYRLNKDELLDILREWNRYLKGKIHLIACGGTAMTLFGVKASTKDIDFMVPDLKEYSRLTKQLPILGYKQTSGPGWQRKGEIFHFDIFRGNKIHTTELLYSPLQEGGNTLVADFSHLYIGILNDYDLISSKLMRGTRVDFDDCLHLAAAHKEELNIEKLIAHFDELVSYDVAADRLRPNIDHFLEQLRENGHYD